MAFDPSIISEIPAYAPDPVAAQGKALTLANAAQGYQEGQLDLATKRQAAADEAQTRQLLKGVDLNTPEGMAKLQQVPPAQRMKLMAGVQEQQAARQTYTLNELKIAGEQVDTLAQTIDPIVAQLDQKAKVLAAQHGGQLTAQDTAQLDAEAKRLGIPALLSLQKSRPDLVKTLNQFQSNPQAFTYEGLRSADAATKHGSQAMRDRIQQEQEAERERHDRAMEGLGEKKAATAAEKGTFTDDERDLLAELSLRNVNLPAGLRSQGQIKATLDGLIARARKADPNAPMASIAEDIKTGKLKLTAETAGARVAGGQVGKVALAANELDTFGDQVLTASKAVPRGAFGLDKNLTLNGLIQMSEKQISDPNLLRLKTKLTALNNAYDQLAARGGTDQDKRAHIHELFDARLSDEAVQVLVKSLKEEAVGAREAAKRTIAEASGQEPAGSVLPGIQGTSPAGGGGGAGSPPSSGAPAPPAGGGKSDADLIAHYGGGGG